MESEPALSLMIGQRVAERRAARRLSLDDLAAHASVSRAMISRIERGEVHASAVVLDKLCGALGITLSELFARKVQSPLLRHADQPVWRDPSTGYLRREVAPAGTASPARIVEVEFPAGAEVSFEPSLPRLADQHVWMLEGRMEIVTGGAVHVLSAGDCLHMRVADGNTFRNTSGQPARYAVILAMEPAP